MKQTLPTWNDIAGHALASWDEALVELSVGLDWMDDDCSDEPVDHAKRDEAAVLIRQAEQLIDRAKDALHASAGRVI